MIYIIQKIKPVNIFYSLRCEKNPYDLHIILEYCNNIYCDIKKELGLENKRINMNVLKYVYDQLKDITDEAEHVLKIQTEIQHVINQLKTVDQSSQDQNTLSLYKQYISILNTEENIKKYIEYVNCLKQKDNKDSVISMINKLYDNLANIDFEKIKQQLNNKHIDTYYNMVIFDALFALLSNISMIFVEPKFTFIYNIKYYYIRYQLYTILAAIEDNRPNNIHYNLNQEYYIIKDDAKIDDAYEGMEIDETNNIHQDFVKLNELSGISLEDLNKDRYYPIVNDVYYSIFQINNKEKNGKAKFFHLINQEQEVMFLGHLHDALDTGKFSKHFSDISSDDQKKAKQLLHLFINDIRKMQNANTQDKKKRFALIEQTMNELKQILYIEQIDTKPFKFIYSITGAKYLLDNEHKQQLQSILTQAADWQKQLITNIIQQINSTSENIEPSKDDTIQMILKKLQLQKDGQAIAQQTSGQEAQEIQTQEEEETQKVVPDPKKTEQEELEKQLNTLAAEYNKKCKKDQNIMKNLSTGDGETGKKTKSNDTIGNTDSDKTSGSKTGFIIFIALVMVGGIGWYLYTTQPTSNENKDLNKDLNKATNEMDQKEAVLSAA